MKANQYDDARWLSRRMTANSITAILSVCAISIGAMTLSYQMGQPFVDRLSAGFASAFSGWGR